MRTESWFQGCGPDRIEIDELGHHVVFKRISDGLLFIKLDGRGRMALVVEANVPSIMVRTSNERGPIIERNRMVDVMYLLSNHADSDLVYFALRLFGYDVPIKGHAYTLPDWYEI
jgi:hypothetical protein